MKIGLFTRKYPNARCVLDYLMCQMEKENHIIISREALSLELSMNVKTVQRSIKALKEHGFIQIHRTGRASAYTINPKIAQYKNPNGHRSYEFTAKVILCQREMIGWLDTLSDEKKKRELSEMKRNAKQ